VKSLLQHYRYCISKKEFDIKNGIEEDVLLEEPPLDIVLEETSLLETKPTPTKEKTKLKNNKSNKK